MCGWVSRARAWASCSSRSSAVLLAHLIDKHRLQRHDAFQVQLAGTIDDPHPPLPEHAEDLVAGHDVGRSQERFDDVDLRRVEQTFLQGQLAGRGLPSGRFERQFVQHGGREKRQLAGHREKIAAQARRVARGHDVKLFTRETLRNGVIWRRR